MNRPHCSRSRRTGTIAIAIVALGASSFGISCSDSLGPELDAYGRARALWEAAELSTYRFDYHLSCYCGSPAGRNVTVYVRDDRVVDAMFHDDGPPATASDIEELPTIDDLFDRIGRWLARKPARFDAVYEATVGYPTYVSADMASNVFDDEFVIHVVLEPIYRVGGGP